MQAGTHPALGVPETAVERTFILNSLSTIYPIEKLKKLDQSSL